jgi:PAS domain S-box-containing protein
MSKTQRTKGKTGPKPKSPRHVLSQPENSDIHIKQMLRTILEHTHILIAYLDPQFNFLLVNKAYAEADGRDLSFFSGKNHFDLYPNAENERIFKNVVKKGKPYFASARPFEYAEHPERGITYWDWSLIPDKDEKGKVIGLVLSLTDVTSRVQTEQERFRLFLAVEQSPVTIVITDPEGYIEYVNPKFVQLTGFSKKEAHGKKLNILKSGEHPRKFYKDIWGTINQGKSWHGEFCNKKKNGDLYWEAAVLSPIKDETGRITHIIGIKEDITERKQIEQELNRYKDKLEALVQERTDELTKKIQELEVAEKKIREAEVQYRTVADFTFDWEYWKLPDGTFQYVSPSVERITGFKPEKFIEDPDLLLKLIHPEDRASWDQHDADMHMTKTHGEIRFRIKTRKGDLRWIQHVCHPVVDKDGRYLGLRASNRDITDQRRAEEDARRQRQELSHMSRVATVGEFTAALSHQLNQPLAAILSNAQAAKRFLESGSFDIEETKDILSSIIEEDIRASEVIKGLRSLLKREEVEFNPVDISNIIQKSVLLMESEANTKAITLKPELDPELPQVLGDRIQLQQVLLNLITNGIDAITIKDSGKQEMIIRAKKQDATTIRVEVQDSGTGIDEKKLAKIFEPFHTTKSWGMGMGLAINKKIVEAHGGRIWAENLPDGGAILSFTLPTT